MNPDDPFGKNPYRAIDEFYRRERKRSEALKLALGPTHTLKLQMDALTSPLTQIAKLQNVGILGPLDQASKVHADLFKPINVLMSLQRLSAVSEAATALSRYSDGLSENIRNLTKSFDTGLLATAKALQGQNGMLAAAMAATRWQDQWKALADQLSPNLLALRTTAERAMMRDMATLRATAEHLQTSTAQIVAEQAIEAQSIVEALTQADTPEESARLFVAFVSVLATVVAQLKENTVDELRRQGLLGLLLIAMTIMSLPQLQPDPSISSEEREAYSELQNQVDALHESLRDIVAAEGELNESYVASLPRAELARRGNIRSKPARDAQKLLTGEEGTPIAVITSAGRWKHVVFRDPLTGQLAQGWVYVTLVTMLDND